ncbi:gliding motility lipoprotein GldB [Hymenobacter lapidiphilus]|uniref:gliding motility lipoprotein GldB n=1 Tax=Hymenobacter sp. CCM 8763 TaxID=2303334 RepID=UPI000E34911D|nr:gliding motility lipoprotein GldB [Hymenobacter sp. CCM 8763]RFP66097.1 gliding motility lipoprotein GldB [Hymenobacter sp. CCM 8763]
MHISARLRTLLLMASAAAGLSLGACSNNDDRCELSPEVAKVEAPVKLERLEAPFFKLKTPADAEQFLQNNGLFARQFLQAGQYPPGVLSATLARLAANAGLQKLGVQADSTFQGPQLQQNLTQLFQHVRYYYSGFRVPPIKTFVSGLSQDLFVNDSLIVLSTDYFVGPKAAYRPNVPGYIQRRYTPEHLVPGLALAISTKYNQKPAAGQTMLGEMLHFGKALYFAEQMLPCTPDSLLIGYSAAEMAGVGFNEGKIWAHFIEKSLLYNTAPFTIQKYIGERPNIPEIDKTAPGRVGAWVGWQIVRKYMAENPKVTLPQLMVEKDAQRILNQSRYRPKVNNGRVNS